MSAPNLEPADSESTAVERTEAERTAVGGRGAGRVLVAVYAILALAATGRSVTQLLSRFGEAPVAYSLSALSALVYVLATIALVARGPRWRRVARATITFELAGVLLIGTVSALWPAALGIRDANPFGTESTVWSWWGAGYLLVPLALPVLGLAWLRSTDPGRGDPGRARVES